MKLLLKISYLGTNYSGYQSQKNGRTVQEQLNMAAFKLFGYACDICGCSRTDKGVHANEFCLTVTKRGEKSLNTDIGLQNIVMALNNYLPDDISVRSAEWREDEFHPRYDVVSKEYVYRIYNGRTPSPFEIGRALYYGKLLTDDSLVSMRDAAVKIVGKHDFNAFMASGSGVTDTVRNVYNIEILRKGDVVEIKISADGFLYNMVRIIVGTLLEVAEGKISADCIASIMESRDRRRAGRTVPPDGLYLNKVVY